MPRVTGPDVWCAVVLLVIALIATADLLDSTSSLVGALAVAPFVASTLCSTSRTALVSAVTLVVGLVLLGLTDDDAAALTTGVRAGVLVVAAALAPVLAATRSRRERRIDDLTRVAEAAQLAVLTPIPPSAGPARLASAYQSASREALIGGDMYAVAETGGGVRLMIGDVRGKGIDAVKVAAVTLAAFRDGTHNLGSLIELADHCDEQLRPHLVDEDFVTALFADIGHDGVAELVSFGHPPPIHAQGERHAEVRIDHPGTPLGFSRELRAVPVPQRMRLNLGDRLLFFTDGLIEARTSQGRFVRPERVVGDFGSVDFEDALGGVLTRLHTETHEVRDDLALLLLEYTGPAVEPEAGSDAEATRDEAGSRTTDLPNSIAKMAPALPVVTGSATHIA